MADEQSISKRVIVGAAWLVTMRWGIRVLGLISTLVLARLLTPEDFGIVAISMAYVGIVFGVTNLNISKALIQFRDAGRECYDTAWTLGLLRGLALAILIVASGIPLASIMDEPRLKAVVMVLALLPLITGIENPYFVEFEKQLNFSKRVILELTAKVVTVASTIVLAFVFKNYWALIIGMLISVCIQILMSFALRPAMPRPCLSETRRLLSFTIWISGNAILSQLNIRVFNFSIGASVGTAPTGKFHMGLELSDLVTELVAPLYPLMYSAYAHLSQDFKRLKEAYIAAAAAQFAVALPAGIGLALISRDFILVVLGEKWMSIVPILALFAVLRGIESLVASVDSVIISLRKQKQTFFREFALTIVTGICIIIAFSYGTLESFVIARFVSGLFYTSFTQYLIYRNLGAETCKRQWFRSWRSIGAALVMVQSVWLIQSVVPESMETGDSILRLAICIVVGGATYISAHLFLWWANGRPLGPEDWIIKNVSAFLKKRKLGLV